MRKNDGNDLFSKGNFGAALRFDLFSMYLIRRKYKKAIDIFNYTTEFTPEELKGN